MEVYFPSSLRALTNEDKIHFYQLLQDSETFDLFLQRRYRTLKRYSLEGGETMIVALGTALDSLFCSRTASFYQTSEVSTLIVFL
jgi:2-oxoglutarate dehydrogenase complex dehydrogenase (E1) component-like enzyme